MVEGSINTYQYISIPIHIDPQQFITENINTRTKLTKHQQSFDNVNKPVKSKTLCLKQTLSLALCASALCGSVTGDAVQIIWSTAFSIDTEVITDIKGYYKKSDGIIILPLGK